MNAVDTNVLVYAIDQSESTKRTVANSLIRQLNQAGDTILLWQVLAEYVNWLTSRKHARVISPAQVRSYATSVRATFPLAMPTPAVLDTALDLADRYSLSHWDSMLLAACMEVGVTTLYTEDMGAPRKIDSLELVNPF